MYRSTQENSRPKIKKMKWCKTNKGNQWGPQQTSKWNKGHHKKRETWIKEENTNYKRWVEQRYAKPQKKESNRNPGNKNSLQSNKKHSVRLLQQTTTSGR
jgi:hypothetical protein